jgi:hypothetical protein
MGRANGTSPFFEPGTDNPREVPGLNMRLEPVLEVKGKNDTGRIDDTSYRLPIRRPLRLLPVRTRRAKRMLKKLAGTIEKTYSDRTRDNATSKLFRDWEAQNPQHRKMPWFDKWDLFEQQNRGALERIRR